MCIYINLQHV